MMPLQRVRDAENRAGNKLSNGPQRAQSNVVFTEYSATLGRRHMPGICRYPAKGTGRAVKQGGTADYFVRLGIVFVLDRAYFLSGIFYCADLWRGSKPPRWCTGGAASRRKFFLLDFTDILTEAEGRNYCD